MSLLTAKKICRVIKGRLIKGKGNVHIKGIVTKPQNVKPGYLYFDIKEKGGKQYIRAAISNGASAVVISQNKKIPFCTNSHPAVISVPCVWRAFWQTVKYYRSQHNIPVVGVTGTSGKTTTTGMIASIFMQRWKTIKTIKNLNLPQFLPERILRLNRGYEAAVFELGMNKKNHIRSQARVVRPDVGIITNIGNGHLHYLKSFKNVVLEKSSIIEGIPHNGFLVLNADDPGTRLIDLNNFKGKVIYYGIHNKADYKASKIRMVRGGTSFVALVDGSKKINFFINTYGKHNVYNALAAVAAARLFKFDIKTIKKGLARFRPPYHRLQMQKGIHKSLIIDDTYNANPISVTAGLEVLSALSGKRKSVAVLGDMLEQGKYEKKNHRNIGKKVEELNIDYLITVGGLAKEIGKGIKTKKVKKMSFNCRSDAANFLRKNLPEKSVVLVKGSRGARMERIVKKLKYPS